MFVVRLSLCLHVVCLMQIA